MPTTTLLSTVHHFSAWASQLTSSPSLASASAPALPSVFFPSWEPSLSPTTVTSHALLTGCLCFTPWCWRSRGVGAQSPILAQMGKVRPCSSLLCWFSPPSQFFSPQHPELPTQTFPTGTQSLVSLHYPHSSRLWLDTNRKVRAKEPSIGAGG